jgi:hypothetical protein
MRHYLAVMRVDPLAIEAHEKGECEHDTFHTIELWRTKVKLTKRSRVNNDVAVELQLGLEQLEYLPPGHRPRHQRATSDGPDHLELVSSLETMNGTARVVDVKRLAQEEGRSVMIQQLTIAHAETGDSCTTTRTFLPYLETPPHLVVEEDVLEEIL